MVSIFLYQCTSLNLFSRRCINILLVCDFRPAGLGADLLDACTPIHGYLLSISTLSYRIVLAVLALTPIKCLHD